MDSNPLVASAVTKLTITKTISVGSYRSIPFVRLEGIAHGELCSTEHIPDLAKAPRNARGKVEYQTRFVLIAPTEPKLSEGRLLVDVPNRGLPVSHAFYNSPRQRPLPIGSLDAGLGFLQEQGFMLVSTQWELGQGFEPPQFVDASGETHYVEAAGFAAVRDVARFLRDSSQADNPLAGVVKRIYAAGYSQTSRFLKSFLLNGFNVVEGRQVIEGFHLVGGAAGQLPLMASGTGPGTVAGSTPAPPNLEHRGVHEEPFTYAAVLATLQARNEPLPKIFVTHFNIDYMGGRASLTRTGAQGVADLALPDNVRMYDIAGSAHLNMREQYKVCEAMHGQLDWSPPLRAQLIALAQWVAEKLDPPASCLMPLRPARPDETVHGAPRYLPQATVLVPQTDADDNSLGGIQVPDVAVPLGTHGRPNAPVTHVICRLAGTYKPFFSLREERLQANDPRLSLEERYPEGLNQYVQRVREVSEQLVAQRYLLAADAAVIVNAAADEILLKPKPTRSIFR
ncbi:MAG: alpha/beta hydrolase domain-containing protein [Zwartia sp.]